MSWRWWMYTLEKGRICPHKSLYADIHHPVFHSGQKVEVLQMPSDECIKSCRSMWWNGRLSIHKQEVPILSELGHTKTTFCWVREARNKGQRLHDSIYRQCPEKAIRGTLIRNEQCCSTCVCHTRFLSIDSKHQVPWDSGVWTWALPSSSTVLTGPAGICYGRCHLWLAVIHGATLQQPDRE